MNYLKLNNIDSAFQDFWIDNHFHVQCALVNYSLKNKIVRLKILGKGKAPIY